MSSPSPTAGSSNSNTTARHSDKHQEKKKTSVDVGKKKRLKNRVEGECRTKLMLRPSDTYTSPEFELEGCLGGF
jgi:hypothetical protein